MTAEWGDVERVASALLYEGYVLYPYHRSALKNQFRWPFGVVGPRATASDLQTFVETQVLIEPRDRPVLDIKLRFLHVETRDVQQRDAHTGWRPVTGVTVGGVEHVRWSEARPVELLLSGIGVGEPFARISFAREIPEWRAEEIVRDERGDAAARVIRERLPLACEIGVEVARLGRFHRVSIRVENATIAPVAAERDALLRHSLVSLHTLLHLTDGEFISLLEPPVHAREHVAECRNQNTWPVLAGARETRTMMLSSPILLYDYPAIAPESQGELCDGTEIDEMLTLRVLTLTDDERRHARATDPLARAIVERGEALSRDALALMHGAERRGGADPASPLRNDKAPDWERWFNPTEATEGTGSSIGINGRRIVPGSRVRLRPTARADAIDMFLAGEAATVAGVFHDVDGGTHVAVTVDADRAAELHDRIGRFLYFRPEEIEVSADGADVPDAQKTSVLVAGIGNMFLGDDGFGPAVVQRLASRELPAHVRVADYGIRGLHLAYELLGGGYSLAILVDAMARGDRPGTVYAIEPDAAEPFDAAPVDAHSVSVETVLGLLRTMASGVTAPRVVIVGCEPAALDPSIGLSDCVAAAVDAAAERVMELIATRGS